MAKSRFPWSRTVGTVATVAGGALFLGAGTLVVRAARKKLGAGTSLADPHAAYAKAFRLSHEAIRRNLRHFDILIDDGAAERASDAFGELVQLYARFLILHHEQEDKVIFPVLRRSSRLRSTDAAHLDAWTREHREVNAAGEALDRAGVAICRGDKTAISEAERLIFELEGLLEPHLVAEEQLINATGLREMVPASAIAEIEAESRKMGGRTPMLTMFFLHSLNPEEQRELFGPAPWTFRKVVVPLLDTAKFRAIREVALEPATAV